MSPLNVTAHTDCIASCARAFSAATDHATFLAAYRGHGLVPGLRAIDAPAVQSIGSVRQVNVADGSVLTETVTAWEPGARHAYTLSGFAPPLRWLLAAAHAEWTFTDIPGGGCHVAWRYIFLPRTRMAAWLLRRLLLPSMQHAMQGCLDRMSGQLNAAVS